jgi:hypothetical protein
LHFKGKKDEDESLWGPLKTLPSDQNRIHSLYPADGILLRGKLKRTHTEISEIPALVKNPASCFWPCCSKRDKKRHIVIRVRVGLAGMGSNGTIVDKSLTVSAGYGLGEPCIEF